VLDDQVLLKSDGFPTYHLAVVVDDHLMQITHVIRGEEWLPSTPKHVLLYQYFGWDPPEFAHLPLLLNPDKSKLSKRQGDVAVEDYRAKGFLRQAIINFVSFLGWNPGDEREIFTLDDLIRDFSLERVGKAGAVFNVDKLLWLNQQHLRLIPVQDLVPEVSALVAKRGWPVPPPEKVASAIVLMRERVTFVHDFVDFSDYLFRDPEQFDPEGRAKSWSEGAATRVESLAGRLESLAAFDHPSLEAALKDLAAELQEKPGLLVHPTRYAISGRTVGPGLYELMEFLGKDTVLRRMRHAVKALG
jgi:glutamyl-tRNA synthetase